MFLKQEVQSHTVAYRNTAVLSSVFPVRQFLVETNYCDVTLLPVKCALY
jgi:hypothetical protein